jgi:hypothetical protein
MPSFHVDGDSLDCACSKFDDTDFAKFIPQLPTSLKHLNFSATAIGSKTSAAIGLWLRNSVELRSITLHHCPMLDSQSLGALCEGAITLTKISGGKHDIGTLDLTGLLPLGGVDGYFAIGRALGAGSISECNLSDSYLADVMMEAIVKGFLDGRRSMEALSLRVHRKSALILDGCRALTPAGMAHLLPLLSGGMLRRLSLYRCPLLHEAIGDIDAAAARSHTLCEGLGEGEGSGIIDSDAYSRSSSARDKRLLLEGWERGLHGGATPQMPPLPEGCLLQKGGRLLTLHPAYGAVAQLGVAPPLPPPQDERTPQNKSKHAAFKWSSIWSEPLELPPITMTSLESVSPGVVPPSVPVSPPSSIGTPHTHTHTITSTRQGREDDPSHSKANSKSPRQNPRPDATRPSSSLSQSHSYGSPSQGQGYGHGLPRKEVSPNEMVEADVADASEDDESTTYHSISPLVPITPSVPATLLVEEEESENETSQTIGKVPQHAAMMSDRGRLNYNYKYEHENGSGDRNEYEYGVERVDRVERENVSEEERRDWMEAAMDLPPPREGTQRMVYPPLPRDPGLAEEEPPLSEISLPSDGPIQYAQPSVVEPGLETDVMTLTLDEAEMHDVGEKEEEGRRSRGSGLIDHDDDDHHQHHHLDLYYSYPYARDEGPLSETSRNASLLLDDHDRPETLPVSGATSTRSTPRSTPRPSQSPTVTPTRTPLHSHTPSRVSSPSVSRSESPLSVPAETVPPPPVAQLQPVANPATSTVTSSTAFVSSPSVRSAPVAMASGQSGQSPGRMPPVMSPSPNPSPYGEGESIEIRLQRLKEERQQRIAAWKMQREAAAAAAVQSRSVAVTVTPPPSSSSMEEGGSGSRTEDETAVSVSNAALIEESSGAMVTASAVYEEQKEEEQKEKAAEAAERKGGVLEAEQAKQWEQPPMENNNNNNPSSSSRSSSSSSRGNGNWEREGFEPASTPSPVPPPLEERPSSESFMVEGNAIMLEEQDRVDPEDEGKSMSHVPVPVGQQGANERSHPAQGLSVETAAPEQDSSTQAVGNVPSVYFSVNHVTKATMALKKGRASYKVFFYSEVSGKKKDKKKKEKGLCEINAEGFKIVVKKAFGKNRLVAEVAFVLLRSLHISQSHTSLMVEGLELELFPENPEDVLEICCVIRAFWNGSVQTKMDVHQPVTGGLPTPVQMP